MKHKILYILLIVVGICFTAMIHYGMIQPSKIHSGGNRDNSNSTVDYSLSDEKDLDITESETSKEESKNQANFTLYAKSAVLLDADSGRVLYEKNGYQVMPMASTTKIMTCIVTLEYGHLDDVVTASKYAARQPKVHLGMRPGQQFTLKNLLYSLMLESHNDAAVAIAEHIGSAMVGEEVTKDTTEEQSKSYVHNFINMMNQKARDIGCFDTFFVTPNGLDASLTDTKGNTKTHSTTAADLARILRYCIRESTQKEQFLEITRTANTSFQDVAGTSNYSCTNHNAFLGMMDGALSGKTGFTAKAGYCYVGSLKQGDKTFVVALLACGWPNNKSYKWSDTKKLMSYGLQNYEYQELCKNPKEFQPLPVAEGQSFSVQLKMKQDSCKFLMSASEQINVQYDVPNEITAPVEENSIVGSANYYIGSQLVKSYPIYAASAVKKINYWWCFEKIWERFAVI